MSHGCWCMSLTVVILLLFGDNSNGQGVTFPASAAIVDTVTLSPHGRFALSLLINQDTEAKVSFQASDSVQFQVLVHPNTDIEIVDGKLNVRCKGLESHPTRTAATGQATVSTVVLRSKTMGSYTIMWRSITETASALEYEVVSDNGQIIILDRSLSEVQNE